MVEAFVTPDMIRWARERSHETTDEAARRISVKPDKLADWESGLARPTIRQAQELAKKLKVPLGYLYLSSPPTESLPLPDLRTVAGAPPRPPSPDFLEVLHDALRKQDWYRERLNGESAARLPFIGRFGLDDSPRLIAADIRNQLRIDESLRQDSNTWEQFLTEFIRRAEENGILVLRSSYVGTNTRRKLNVDEFRGFAISDDLAPVVFVNSADAKAAQTFTLAHELAHLWVGESGVSNPDYMRRSGEQENAVDRLCDSVAAEVLVPGADFVTRWSESDAVDDNLLRLAARYRVSAFVILRRAFELGNIERDLFRTKYRELLERSAIKSAGGGGNFYALLLSRNSNTFTTALMVAAAEGHVLPREAARLLNVRVSTLPGIEKNILEGERLRA